MKQVKYFEALYKDKTIIQYAYGNEHFKKLYKFFKNSDKNILITRVYFNDNTRFYNEEYYDMINLFENGVIKMKEQRENKEFLDNILKEMKHSECNNKALADFRKLSISDKYKECIHYGDIKGVTNLDVMNGCMTLENMSIYNKDFLFILLNGQVINYYELQ